MTLETSSTADAVARVAIGDHCARRLRYSEEQIAAFAAISGDSNPVHRDAAAARAARHRRIIASGEQTAAHLMGLATSHLSRTDDVGAREVLALNFNFAFKAPVFADTDIDLAWTVTAVEWRDSLGGWIVQAEGSARDPEHLCVVARGTLLVRPAPGV